jgi:hypothetical protein
MIDPVRARMTAVALAAALLLAGASSARAAFVKEGSPYAVGDEPYSLTAGDFNGDGRPDVVTMNGTSSDLSVYLRRAGGGFAQESGSPVSVGAGSGPSSVAVGDFNGDGRRDLAVSRFVAGGVSVLLRQAAGGFAPEGTPVLNGTSMRAVGVGDFNSDGRPDLAATLSSGGVVLLLRNATSNPGFTQGQSFGTGSGPVAIAVGDYNGDGLADLAIANENDDNVTILRRNATTFTPEATVTVGDRPSGIVAADFDANGRADLAVANYNSGTVTVLMRNSLNSGFAALAPIRISNTPVGIDAADFDRDGRPDLAVASNAGAVDVLHRTATGFTRDQPIALAGAVNDVVAADFNGDARPDLAASSYGAADTFSALLNPAPPPPQGLPDPVPHKNVNALPKSGTVKIKLPGEDTFVALTEGEQIPLGTTVDTRKGRVTIVAAAGGGQTSDFYDGLFKLSQTKGKKPITTATLVEKLNGCKANKKASAAAKKKRKRRLWGDGKGRFRTKGKNSAATVLGTKWLVEDRCGSTLTRVARGKVKVRDFVKHKTVTVRKGKRYIARAKRR